MRLVRRALLHHYHPIRSIEWILAVSSFATGLYLFSPLYQISLAQNGPVGVALLFSHPLNVLFWGAMLIIGSCLVAYALWNDKPRLRSVGWFTLILTRLFQAIGVVVISGGLLPISWMPPLTMAAVMLVLWSRARAEVKQNAKS